MVLQPNPFLLQQLWVYQALLPLLPLLPRLPQLPQLLLKLLLKSQPKPKLQLRLQTVGPPAAAVLQDALGTVHDIGQHVLGVFDEAVAAHKAKPPASR